MIGRRLSHFRIDAKLGEGGMGVVYRATDESLRREVALKVLPAALSADDERRRRFVREARSAAAVTHNNIATVHEVGEADGHVFIAMELVPGVTLREYMAPGLPHAEGLRIATEIAKGLARAHAKGVVHRDLKPENVMVTPDGDVKILDFGLAKLGLGPVARSDDDDDAPAPVSARLTEEGRVMGTPSYMSPEQVDGRIEIDARSDVFSFGVMLYELLAGVRPFVGATSVDILYAILHRDPEPLDAVAPAAPEEAVVVVARCLSRRREDRLASGREVLIALAGDQSIPPPEVPSGRSLPAPRLVTVSGMGTALGATVASESGSNRAAKRPAAGAPRARRVLAWALAALTVVALGGGILYRARARSGLDRPPPNAAALPSSAPRGVAMTEHPPPRSSSPDAVVHYASGLSRLRVGGLESEDELRGAVARDPALAAAHLRLALYGAYYDWSPAERRRSYARASLLAAALEPRDKALLPVAEALAGDPTDFHAALDRAQAALRQFPEDAEMALVVYTIVYLSGTEAERRVAFDRVLALDPHATQVLDAEAYLAIARGDTGLAKTLVDRCIALVPEASYCRQLRAQLDAAAGRCDEELVEAREMVKLDPDAVSPYAVLAQALAATGAPVASIKGAFAQVDARTLPSVRKPKGIAPVELALLAGDFEAADRAALSLASSVESSSSERDHAIVTTLRIAIAEESGDRAGALALADGFEHEAAAWAADAPLAVRAKRLYLHREAGTLAASAFDAGLARLVDEWATLGGGKTPAERSAKTLAVAARDALTPDEARRALALSTAGGSSGRKADDLDVHDARLLVLAGRPAEAVEPLTRFARSCRVVASDVTLDDDLAASIDHVHASLLLGQAREATGDVPGACEAYGRVSRFWPDPKPRSVSAAKAKERATALRCPSR